MQFLGIGLPRSSLPIAIGIELDENRPTVADSEPSWVSNVQPSIDHLVPGDVGGAALHDVNNSGVCFHGYGLCQSSGGAY